MNGLLAVWNDCDAHMLSRYEDWYMHEHLPDRVGLEGVLNGVRYEVAGGKNSPGSPRFFTSYDLADVEVLNSPAYQQMLQTPSALTQEIMPHFLNMWRTVAQLRAHAGRSAGAWIVTLRLGQLLGSAAPRLTDLRSWTDLLAHTAPPRACRWRVYESIIATQTRQDTEAAAKPSPEARFRPGTDASAHAVVLIEHLREADARSTLDEWLYSPAVRALLAPQDRIDIFLEMARMT